MDQCLRQNSLNNSNVNQKMKNSPLRLFIYLSGKVPYDEELIFNLHQCYIQSKTFEGKKNMKLNFVLKKELPQIDPIHFSSMFFTNLHTKEWLVDKSLAFYTQLQLKRRIVFSLYKNKTSKIDLIYRKTRGHVKETK